MPRILDTSIEEYKTQIINWYQSGDNVKTVAARLETEYGFTTSTRTLERRLKTWNVTRRRQHVNSSDESLLRDRIAHFYQQNKSDAEIVAALRAEGIVTSDGIVKARRKKLGFKRSYSHQE